VGNSLTSLIRYLGPLGLFFLAILDSSPLPTFAGPDILIAVLAFRGRQPWYTYTIVATAGSVIGAFFTFHLARKAGSGYLNSHFGKSKLAARLATFHKWGRGALIASTAIPFPFPTSMFFAAAGVSGYRTGPFLVLVAVCRAVRYTTMALVAQHYGRPFIRLLRRPMDHPGWFIASTAIVLVLIAAGILMNRRVAPASS
jgi:membrane protein YqaA with SNARE-associated domain